MHKICKCTLALGGFVLLFSFQSARSQDAQQKMVATMGDFQRHKVKSIHDIYLTDSKKKLVGRIHIVASYEAKESWDHLKGSKHTAPAPAGPHNRRVIDTLTGVTVAASGTSSEAKPSKDIQAIADELKANKGLVRMSGEEKKVILFEDPDFESAFRERMKSSSYDIRFQKNL